MLAGTSMYFRHGPRTVGPEHGSITVLVSLLRVGPVGHLERIFVGAFLPLCPRPMLGHDTRATASRRLTNKGFKVIDGTQGPTKMVSTWVRFECK